MADNVLQEQLWFAGTTLVVNGLLLSEAAQHYHPVVARGASTLISIYAAYLILERSAEAAGTLPPDESPKEAERAWRRKKSETWRRFKVMPAQFLFVVSEFSGSLFYLLIVLGSCLAVWIGR